MSILQGKEYRKKRGGQSIGVGGRRRPLSKGGRLGENREGELLRREKKLLLKESPKKKSRGPCPLALTSTQSRIELMG